MSTPRTRPPNRVETQASFAARLVSCPTCCSGIKVKRGTVCSECRAKNRAALAAKQVMREDRDILRALADE